MQNIADAATIKSVKIHSKGYVSYIRANSIFYFGIESVGNLIIIMQHVLGRLPLRKESCAGWIISQRNLSIFIIITFCCDI